MNKKLLLVGEPMGLFIAQNVGKLEAAESFSMAVAGAEFNVAVGVTRLNQDVSYLTKLGNDPFGKKIINTMNENNISTKNIVYSEDRATGFMLKSMVESGDPDIFYFRKGSAASTLSVEDIRNIDFTEFDFVHLTGIFPALNENTRKVCEFIADKANEYNIPLSFDPNLRPQLWTSEKEMIDFMNSMARKCDIFLPGIGESKTLIGEDKPEKIAQRYLDMGVKTVIIKLGPKGAYYKTATEEGYVDGFKVERVVDTVGAGDGFAVGVISAMREALPIEECVRRAAAIGAIQVTHKSDNEGLPNRSELNKFMSGDKNWRESK